jgi:hypothetical protein
MMRLFLRSATEKARERELEAIVESQAGQAILEGEAAQERDRRKALYDELCVRREAFDAERPTKLAEKLNKAREDAVARLERARQEVADAIDNLGRTDAERLAVSFGPESRFGALEIELRKSADARVKDLIGFLEDFKDNKLRFAVQIWLNPEWSRSWGGSQPKYLSDYDEVLSAMAHVDSALAELRELQLQPLMPTEMTGQLQRLAGELGADKNLMSREFKVPDVKKYEISTPGMRFVGDQESER